MIDAATVSTWLGPRALFTTTVPLVVAAGPAVFLLLSGAPGQVNLTKGGAALRAMGLAEAVLTAVVLLILTVSLHPLLNVYREAWTASRLRLPPGRRWHLRRARRLMLATQSSAPDGPAAVAAARAAALLRARYPSHRGEFVSTALGNAILAAVERGGIRYGLDVAVVWPRLYPLLKPEVRALADDRRTMLDATVTLTGAWALAAIGWAALLIPSRDMRAWYALILLAVAALSYRAAVDRAVAYGEALEVAFDLCRNTLYEALRLPIPVDPGAEQATADLVNRWLAQDVRPRTTDGADSTSR